MRRSAALILVLLASFAGPLARGGDGDTVTDWADWKDARGLYDAGRYEEALRAFLAQPAPENAAYYYNLGTVSFRLGRPGTALAYLDKANRLAPHDTEIRHNLALAQKMVEDTLGNERLDPASNSLEKLSDRIDLDEVRGTLGLLGIFLFLLWTRTYLKTRDLKQTFLKPSCILALTAFSITGLLYLAQQASALHPPADLIERQVIRSGPGDHFVELGQAEAGTRVRVLGESISTTAQQPAASPAGGTASGQAELWRQIRFSREGIGWIRASSLLLL